MSLYLSCVKINVSKVPSMLVDMNTFWTVTCAVLSQNKCRVCTLWCLKVWTLFEQFTSSCWEEKFSERCLQMCVRFLTAHMWMCCQMKSPWELFTSMYSCTVRWKDYVWDAGKFEHFLNIWNRICRFSVEGKIPRANMGTLFWIDACCWTITGKLSGGNFETWKYVYTYTFVHLECW